MEEGERLEQELLQYLQTDGLSVYIYNMDHNYHQRNNQNLVCVPLPSSWFSTHPISQVIHLSRLLFNIMDGDLKIDNEHKEEYNNMMRTMYSNILFGGNFDKRLLEDDIRLSLQRFELFVQGIGFLLYGYGLSADEPNYFSGRNLPPKMGDACIKRSKLDILVKGEIGQAGKTMPLPLIKGRCPFVAQDDQPQKRLLQTIRLFRDRAMHINAINYDFYELYNIGGICSEPIRRNLALSSLHMIEYHYNELSRLIK